MDAQSALPEMPEFDSLKEIMERFYAVPFDQFQLELNEWFKRNLEKCPDACTLHELQNSGTGNLPALVSEIYHRAELNQALSEAKIVAGNGKN